MNCQLKGLLSMAAGWALGVICSGLPGTTIDIWVYASWGSVMPESLAYTSKMLVPTAVGVPVIVPVAGLRLSPGGRLPGVMVQVIGAVPPGRGERRTGVGRADLSGRQFRGGDGQGADHRDRQGGLGSQGRRARVGRGHRERVHAGVGREEPAETAGAAQVRCPGGRLPPVTAQVTALYPPVLCAGPSACRSSRPRRAAARWW